MLIFTDGSFSKNPDMGGLGAVIVDKNKETMIGRYSNKCIDNNVAEIAAITMAIHYIRKNKSKDKTITILSDSLYAIKRIQRNGKGRSEFEQKCLDYIQNFLGETDKKVYFLHIKGHTHNNTKLSKYNNIADSIAKEERNRGLNKYNQQINKMIIKNKRKNSRR